ncbi:iron-sulfur cluster assembly accessory protein [Ectobacillus antri]|jgi:iron-sulfur cluster assembly protein|uniref:Iron-sulfur cluster assembly accessory protein n=1 Tax=Ectobacillus antri TaxID=2486280 RepID=A0ABT6H7X6_9BACI|nr:iron-sulfur cluster assembly accessory protein [Ectobacillus antri]MDG4658255.1 iron-sulfur cluster assembly accessory protein [Ectobacillus antri]MDG5755364.1 iron-sulfur cluster assembly accessory protein [Ectobacillus antri]
MIVVTEQAALQIQDMIKQADEGEQFVRLAVKGGGCSGLSYGLGFEPEAGENDEILTFHGVKFIIDKQDAPVLQGVKIDYKQSMLGGGFTIDNPNAIATCGCGSSFRTATNQGTPEQC